jgi:hypothetical protein
LASKLLRRWAEDEFVDVYILGRANREAHHPGLAFGRNANLAYIILIRLLDIWIANMLEQFRFHGTW